MASDNGSDDIIFRPEQRRHYLALGERVAGLEVTSATMSREISQIRTAVHDVRNTVASIGGHIEAIRDDNKRMMVALERVTDAISLHDRRDDERFVAHGSLIGTMQFQLKSVQQSVDDAAEEKRSDARLRVERWHLYVLAGLGGGAVIVGAVIGAYYLAKWSAPAAPAEPARPALHRGPP